MKRKFLILTQLFLIATTVQAQDPDFTRFFTNPIYYNPALSAADREMNVRMNYRNFWRKADKGYNTLNLSINSNEPFLSGGVGLIAQSGIEGNGIIKSNMLGLSYAYKLIVMPRSFDIQMGLQGAWVQKRFYTGDLIFSDQLDPLYGATGTTAYSPAGVGSSIHPDFSSGINFRFNLGKVRRGRPLATVNAGYAAHHITRPNESFTGMDYRVPIKNVAYINTVISTYYSYDRPLFITPALIYEKQASFQTLVFGANLKIKPLYAGLWFRNSGFRFDSGSWRTLAFAAGLDLSSATDFSLQLGYSYEVNISELQNMLGNTHEISLRLRFDDLSLFGQANKVSRKARDNRACYNKF